MSLSVGDLKELISGRELLSIKEDDLNNVKESFDFLQRFSSDKIIYGINTGFGPMAQYRIEKEELNMLQYNLIRSHSSGVGRCLSDEEIRAVLYIRLNTFLLGKSGVSMAVIDQIKTYLKYDILPEIYEHGSVGASGDLVQLAHVGLALIGEGVVRYKGESRNTSEVLNEVGIAPLKLSLRDGLGIINGTSCMTGIAVVNLIRANKLIELSIGVSSMINEIVGSFNDSFSEELNAAKRHRGQSQVAQKMRNHVEGSKLIKSRSELFEANESMTQTKFEKRIQEYYSIRCVPQIIGPILDTYSYTLGIVEDEINSTSDNPVVSIEKDNVFHGGNFHGDYISLEMDKLKLAIAKLGLLNERQLNFLLNHALNKQFPPFLNAGVLGLNFGLQGVQYVATSNVAENQTLSNSVYVHSIPNNNDNQDVVSMGTNSAVICRKVIENTGEILAINLIAVALAVDISGDTIDNLSESSKKLYAMVRDVVPNIKEDISMSPYIRKLAEKLLEL